MNQRDTQLPDTWEFWYREAEAERINKVTPEGNRLGSLLFESKDRFQDRFSLKPMRLRFWKFFRPKALVDFG